LSTIGERFAAADACLFRRLVGRRSPAADRLFWGVSRIADRSTVWFLLAGVLARNGGSRGRRAALRGVVAIGLASALTNGPLKHAWRRPRPQVGRDSAGRGLIAPPRSSSFPSGHAASAFAFATAAGAEYPALVLPVGALAVAVAYSRVHTGVHYPSDVLVGCAVGLTAGLLAGRLPLDGERARAEEARRQRIVPPPRRAVVLFSPHAGSAGRLDRARRAMVEAGVEILEEVPIHNHEHLDEWVSRAHEDPVMIVAAGGDGTVGTAADHVVNTEAVLGILPLGTSNDFARSLGIPIDPVRAARLLRTGTVASIDAGRLVAPGLPAMHFVHAATVGLNVSFAKLATKASLRRRFGRLTYAFAGALALREHQPFECELRYDGNVEQLELLQLSVINAPVFGGFLGMRISGARLDDGVLDVIAVEDLPIRRLLLAAAHPLFGIKRPIRGIRTLHVPGLRVHTTQDLEVALDGEIRGKIPADFEVAGESLRVVIDVHRKDAAI
jgi:undecaprenyl-diphosphatase